MQYQGRALQLTLPARFRLSPQSRVLVRETAEGQLCVLQVDAREREHAIPGQPAPLRLPKPAPSPTPPARATPWRPPADHPWRRQFTEWIAERRTARAQAAAGHS